MDKLKDNRVRLIGAGLAAFLAVLLIVQLIISIVALVAIGNVGKSQLADDYSQDTSYTFNYFDYRGRGEETRLLLIYAEQPFEDVRYNRSYWFSDVKKTARYGQLPYLDVNDGRRLYESYAISRYLAKRFDLAGKGAWEQAKVDEFADFHKDNDNEWYDYGYMEVLSENDTRLPLLKESTDKKFPTYVSQIEASGSGFPDAFRSHLGRFPGGQLPGDVQEHSAGPVEWALASSRGVPQKSSRTAENRRVREEPEVLADMIFDS
ncbi:putative glutathione S-transferase 5 [Ditylenchus destructor]|nr:putative glutathione S-transferase 5 [Ditylenchus destructor]